MASTRAPAKKTPRKAAAAQPAAEALQSLVVYVHGVGAHPSATQLKLQWDLALFGRDMGARSRMAYWSDLLHEPMPAGAKSAAARRDDSNEPPDLEACLAAAGMRAPSGEALQFAEALSASLGVPKADTATRSVGGARKKVLPLPSWLRKPISRRFLEAFVGDTAAYFFKPGMRSKIRARLAQALDLPKGQPVTIVAHSQGSVIAYELLSMLKEKNVPFVLDALVTIGSPLGVREVQDFLVPGDLSIPPLVRRWYNFSDPLDPVALDKGLAGDFSATHVTVQDEIVRNGQARHIAGFNPHSAVGYLAHPRVRKVVNDAMRTDLMARFVVARDVAERLGSEADARHPVLIEVLEPGYRALGEDDDKLHAHERAEAKALQTVVQTRNARSGDANDPEPGTLRLEQRVKQLADGLEALVTDVEAARIDPLRRFVAARLTPFELQQVAQRHRELRVYAVWQSSRKSKFTDHRSMRAIKADAALTSFSADGNGITWAVLDTGARMDHPHFAGVIDHVWDCTRRGAPVALRADRDTDGHGSHVSGIIAGASPDGRHRGVAPKARLVVYKVLNDKGEGEDAWIIKALDHIARTNENAPAALAVHGVNLSLGSPFDPSVYGCGFSPVCTELRRLWRNGVLAVVASGNEGMRELSTSDGFADIATSMSIGDPANLEECIAVGAVNCDNPHTYGVWAYSSRGPTADGRAKPDLVAPGERVVSCNSAFRGPRSMYREDSGTSMAAPHVSGLLAAFLSVRREFRGRPDDVKRLLLKACTDLGRDRYHQGHGLPNLMQMLLNV